MIVFNYFFFFFLVYFSDTGLCFSLLYGWAKKKKSSNTVIYVGPKKMINNGPKKKHWLRQWGLIRFGLGLETKWIIFLLTIDLVSIEHEIPSI